MKELYRFIHFFGFYSGVTLFWKFKFSRLQAVRLPEYRNSFQLRPGTTDIAIFKQLFFNRCYDLPYPFAPATIIDAGANIGLACVFFAKRFPDARIVALEPEAGNYQLLKKNTSALPNVACLRSALWPREELLDVTDPGLGAAGFAVDASAAGEVPAYTVNKIMDQFEMTTVDILKIDIEGSEAELFSEGADVWLRKTKCLIIEVHDEIRQGCSNALFAALAPLNFRMSVHGENLVFLNRDLL